MACSALSEFTAGMPVDQLGWYSKRRYPDPIIPRELRREVAERVDCMGSGLLPLNEAAVRAAIDHLSDERRDVRRCFTLVLPQSDP